MNYEPSALKYKELMSESFQVAYQNQKDNWTSEHEMLSASDVLLSLVDTKLDYRILDIGCGKGVSSAKFVEHVNVSVVGLDIVNFPEWTTLEDSRYGKLKFHSCYFPDTPKAVNYQSGNFNAIFDNGCFHHQHPNDYTLYLRKIRSLISNGGIFFINVPFADGLKSDDGIAVGGDGRIANFFTAPQLETLVEKFGFRFEGQLIVQRKVRDMKYLYCWFRAA